RSSDLVVRDAIRDHLVDIRRYGYSALHPRGKRLLILRVDHENVLLPRNPNIGPSVHVASDASSVPEQDLGTALSFDPAPGEVWAPADRRVKEFLKEVLHVDKEGAERDRTRRDFERYPGEKDAAQFVDGLVVSVEPMVDHSLKEIGGELPQVSHR